MSKNKRATLLFELGALQVFHFQTDEEYAQGPQSNVKEVYWQDIKTLDVFGPFYSIHEAMSHYTWVVSQRKAEQAQTSLPNNVIRVDFKAKKRIV